MDLHDTMPATDSPRTAPVRETSATLDESAGGSGGAAAPPRPRGATIGRYMTLSVLGAGAMGVVYAAFDPELERKVAVKVLPRGAASEDQRVRLVREARTLAKLGHPNVVAVFDVGSLGDEVFLAMEHVEGRTVGAWLRERPRSVQEVLDVFVAAGRGLAAAHAAGIVHRDFKPDNMMIGADGRVRVLDFGLARDGQALSDASLGETLVSGSASVTDMRLTRDGALLGTPAYMAPEQWNGAEATPAADQFGFAVSLWEALYGQRPFRGESMHALMSAVLAGQVTPAPSGRRVPAYLRRALDRALALDPARRFPGMDALLAAIERGRAGRRWTGVLVGLAAAGLVAGGAAGLRAHKVAACEASGAEIAAVWDDAARERLRVAVLASGAPYAATSFERAAARIDAWTDRWRALRAEACREATVEGARPPELLARGEACLAERQGELAALLAAYAAPTAADLEQLAPAAASLPPLDPCVERSALLRRPEMPEETGAKAQIEALRRDVARVQALGRAGRAEALGQAEALLPAVEATGYLPLAVELRRTIGGLAARPGSLDRAEAELARVFRDAGSIGADEIAAAAAVQLVKVVGVDRARAGEGAQWALSAEVLVARLGEERGPLGAALLMNRALVARAQGDVDEAIALHERALALREALLGEVHPDVAASLNHLANALRDRGDFPAALAALRRALEIRREALGPDHPAVGATLNNLALLEQARGDREAARAYLEQALAIVEAASGPDSLDTAKLLDNLGRAHHLRGDYAAAEPLLARALEIRERRLGPQDLDVASSLQNLGLLKLVRGDRVGARALFERVLAIRERRLAEDHPDVLVALDNLGTAQQRLGALAEAEALHTRALEALKVRRGSRHASVALALRNLAIDRLARGQTREALALADEALTIGEASLGREHPDVAVLLNTLGAAQRRIDAAAAEASLRRALAISLKTRGEGHPGTALSQQRLAEVLTDRGALDEAEALLARALATREAIAGEAPEVADVLVARGELALARAEVEPARRWFERAATIRAGGQAPAYELAEARFGVARALAAAGDRAGARRLAGEAAGSLRALGPDFTGRAAEVEAWARK